MFVLSACLREECSFNYQVQDSYNDLGSCFKMCENGFQYDRVLKLAVELSMRGYDDVIRLKLETET